MSRPRVIFTNRHLKAVWIALIVSLVSLSSACLFTTEPERPQGTNEDGTPLIRELKVFAIPGEAASFMLNPRPVGDQGYVFGVEVTINVLPEEGWELVEWVGPVYEMTDRNAKIAMTGSRTVVARLQLIESLVAVPPTPTPVPTPVATVATPTVAIPTPTPVREKCVDQGISDENHLFHGHAGGTTISAIVKDTRVVVATAEGGRQDLSAPYVLAIPVCDGEGWSLVGENVGFKLDGNLARQNVSLRAGGLDKLDLFTTQIAPAKRPTLVPTPTISYEPTATPPPVLSNKPGPPTNVQASYDPNGVRVSWSPPNHTGRSNIQNYTVAIFPSNLGLNAHGGSTSVLIPGSYLQAGIAYTFTVTAFNANGMGDESLHSNEVVFTGIQAASAPIPTATRVPIPTSTPIPYSGVSPTPTPLPTPTPIPSVVMVPTATPVPVPNSIPTPIPAATATLTPTAVPTPTATPVPTVTPTPTPSGDLILFIRAQGSASGTAGTWTVYSDGTGETRISTSIFGQNDGNLDSSPAWSLDGSKIAYSIGHMIYIANADGSNEERIVHPKTGAGQAASLQRRVFSPSWSPDGTKLAVVSNWASGGEWDNEYDIYLIDLDGAGVVYQWENNPRVTRLTYSGGLKQHVSWSPNGSKIAFTDKAAPGYPGSLYIMNPDGTGLIDLRDFGGVVAVSPYSGEIDWSPDGLKILFVSKTGGSRNDSGPTVCSPDEYYMINNFNCSDDIFVINIDGSGELNLTNWPAGCEDGTRTHDYGGCGTGTQDFNPDWSPDGSKIAYATSRFGAYQIMTMNADGSGQTRLASPNWFYGIWPKWKP